MVGVGVADGVESIVDVEMVVVACLLWGCGEDCSVCVCVRGGGGNGGENGGVGGDGG